MPPPGAPGARQNRSKTCGRSSGRMPGPWSSTVERAPSSVAPHPTRTVAAARAVADGVVDQDRDHLAQARAGRRPPSPARVDLHAHPPAAAGTAIARRGLRRDVAQLDRLERQVQRPRVGARQQQQVVHQRWSGGRPRRRCRRARCRPPPPAGARCSRRCSTLERTTVSGRAQLVAGVRRELPLALERLALRGQRRPGWAPAPGSRRRRPGRSRRTSASMPPHDQHPAAATSSVCSSCRPVLDDLDQPR